jgi:hypothetical protein
MGRAEKLVVLLADEGVRWKETVENLGIEIEQLVGNVFLSCACIVPLTGRRRFTVRSLTNILPNFRQALPAFLWGRWPGQARCSHIPEGGWMIAR